MNKGSLAVMVALGIGCSSSSSGPTTTDTGTGGGSDTGTGGSTDTGTGGTDSGGGGDGCSGTYSGAVKGNISCGSPLLVNKDLVLTGTLSGTDVDATSAITLKGKDALAAKTYKMTDLAQIDAQITAGSAGKTWSIHYASTDTSPPNAKWAATVTISSLSPAHGTIDLTLAEETDATTVTEHVTF